MVGASAPRSGVDVAQEPQAAATFSKVLAHSPHIFLRVDGVMPTTPFLHADGNTLQTGWANSPRVEAEIAAWFDATSFDDELTAMRRLDKTALEEVVYAPLYYAGDETSPASQRSTKLPSSDEAIPLRKTRALKVT